MGKGFSYHIAADAVKARLDALSEELRRVSVHPLRPAVHRSIGAVPGAFLTVVAVQRRINTVTCFVICAHL